MRFPIPDEYLNMGHQDLNLVVYRYNSGEDHTNGVMLCNEKFQCYTLEDEFRTKKVFGETRIPDGYYCIGLRTVGTLHERYKAKYNQLNGMLEILDVPGFEAVLIHIGNDDEDTAGCVLVGYSVNKGDNFVGNSTAAYNDLYQKVLDTLVAGFNVSIELITLDKPQI